jgi:hypothetical protein
MNSKGLACMFLLSVIGAGLSQNAAAIVYSQAQTKVVIDWEHFQLSVSGINNALPTVTYTNPLTSLFTYSDGYRNYSDQTSVPNWATPVRASVIGVLGAVSVASATTFSGLATKELPVDFAPEDDPFGSTHARGSRQIDYSIDGPGILTVIVPYSLSVSVLNSNLGRSYAEVSAHGDFQGLANIGDSNFDSSIRLNSNSSKSGDLVLDILASGAGHGTLYVNFDVVSSVPEPETYAMLLTGLGLLGFIVRRRKQIS